MASPEQGAREWRVRWGGPNASESMQVNVGSGYWVQAAQWVSLCSAQELPGKPMSSHSIQCGRELEENED